MLCGQPHWQPRDHTLTKHLLSSSCLQKDITLFCVVPLCLISFSQRYLWCWAGLRSAHWWWTGGASGQCLCVASMLCQPLPVPASAASAPPRFSARKPDWTVCPSRYGSFIHVTYSLWCAICNSLIYIATRFTKALSQAEWKRESPLCLHDASSQLHPGSPRELGMSLKWKQRALDFHCVLSDKHYYGTELFKYKRMVLQSTP